MESVVPIYQWKNEKGEIAETDKHNVPPDAEGKWHRYYGSISIGAVSGAGGSPARAAHKKTQ